MKIEINLESDLIKLIDCEALELYVSDSKDTVYIPYMMNDALECYYIFKECNIIGQWEKENQAIEVSLVDNGGRSGLALNQSGTNTVTIWYGSVEKHVELYQYHRIAHLWVSGNENWRRLMYIVGTLYDKLSFMGDEYCNSIEKELVPLANFAPFRYWTPIHEPLDEFYSDSIEGIDAIQKYIDESGDKRLIRMIAKYRLAYSSGKISRFMIFKMAVAISCSQKLYDVINDRITAASCNYQERIYPHKLQKHIEKSRDTILSDYQSQGYSGNYPILTKDNLRVTFYEEHPYIMQDFEYDNFGFSINPIIEKVRSN